MFSVLPQAVHIELTVRLAVTGVFLHARHLYTHIYRYSVGKFNLENLTNGYNIVPLFYRFTAEQKYMYSCSIVEQQNTALANGILNTLVEDNYMYLQ